MKIAPLSTIGYSFPLAQPTLQFFAASQVRFQDPLQREADTVTLRFNKARLPADLKRELGSYSTGVAGPLVILVGGIHGNEPDGVIAIQRLLRMLESGQVPFNGAVVGLAGHLQALKVDRRQLVENLNRLWDPQNVHAVESRKASLQPLGADEQELLDLLAAIREPVERHQAQFGDRRLLVLDLHGTSAPGIPFGIAEDSEPLRQLLQGVPFSVLINFEQYLHGVMNLNIQNLLGLSPEKFYGLAFEGGQNQQENTIQNHMAAIWYGLERMGCVATEHRPPEIQQYLDRLNALKSQHPPFLRITGRVPVQHPDRFAMRSSQTGGMLRNIHEVAPGEVIGQDGDTKLCAPSGGKTNPFIVMPNYQPVIPVGDDAYFTAEAA